MHAPAVSRPVLWAAVSTLLFVSACSSGFGLRRGLHHHDTEAAVAYENELTAQERASTHYLKGIVARNEGDFLLQFLKDTLNAEEIPTRP